MSELRKKRSTRDVFAVEFLETPLCTEQAVDVRQHGIAGMNYYHHEDNPPYWHRAPGSIPELFVREGILARLLNVNDLLGPLGFELFLFDAYRPLAVQNYFHDEWVPEYLHQKFPEWSAAAIREEVGKYWSKGVVDITETDRILPPPHASGGVVDLTLRHLHSGEELFMGSLFDEVSAISHVDYFEEEGIGRILTSSEEVARGNRRLLYGVMTEAGFTGNPNEWWHFGYGDRLTASLTGAPAVYSLLKHDV